MFGLGVCFGVCFGGLLRGLLRDCFGDCFGVCFGVCFEFMLRSSSDNGRRAELLSVKVNEDQSEALSIQYVEGLQLHHKPIQENSRAILEA